MPMPIIETDSVVGFFVTKLVGSWQKKVQRDFEKPSFEEKTRFLAHVLDVSELVLRYTTYRGEKNVQGCTQFR